jgi:NitT/TauT family transport system substrate-binding protein
MFEGRNNTMEPRYFIGKLARLLIATMVIGSPAASAQQLTNVVLRTDFRFNGYVTPLALALDRGYYRDDGLNVEIGQGQGSGITIQTVASGVDTFGLADSATAMLAIASRDIPIKLVSVYNQTAVSGFIYNPDSGFDGKIQGLRGRIIISSPGAAELTLLNPSLASGGMTTNDVDLRLVELNARVPLFLTTPGALLMGFATGDLLRVRSQLPNAAYTPFASYGVITYGTGIITSDSTIRTRPDVVRKFVAATAKGWRAAIADQAAAVQAGLKLFPDVDRQLLAEGLRVSIEQQLHTPATIGKPLGWTAESDWSSMSRTLQQYAKMPAKPPSAFYTNDFAPVQ